LEGATHQVAGDDVEFIHDITASRGGQRVSEQMIFDRVLGMIRQAEDFVLADLFLFNEYMGKESKAHRRLCQEVTEALLAAKQRRPGIRILVITDPINEVYGGRVPESFKKLRAAGIPVVPTNLGALRDSNPLYSGLWRLVFQWFGNSERGWLPHPFAATEEKVSARSWLALLNFKANHRKLIVADAPAPGGGRQMACLVMSANPHDASSAHNNVALLVRGGPWRDLIQGEEAVLSVSAKGLSAAAMLPDYARNDPQSGRSPRQTFTAAVRVLTEAKIRKGLLEVLAGAGSGDRIDIAMFYLGERRVIKGLLDAARRGAAIRLLLDLNRDAFGYEKNGIPNRPAAAELIEGGKGRIAVRWFKTQGEQFHTKMVLVRQAGKATLLAGSANLTRRNLGDLNLETDLEVSGAPGLPAIQAAGTYFEKLWTNQELDCSVPYAAHAESSRWKHWTYRFQEWTGLTTF